MDVLIENRRIIPEFAQVPVMNYGQMQRWGDFVRLHYSIELPTEIFIEKIENYFSEFREAEIAEDDPDDFPELKAYKDAGWPDLKKLVKDHNAILKELIFYHQYEILHLILKRSVTKQNYCYSVNSVDEVIIENERIKLIGICFQSDYVEHTYNHELSRKNALLKTIVNRT